MTPGVSLTPCFCRGSFQQMQLLIVTGGQKKPRHRPSCRTSFHVPFKIELAPMAWAFKKPAAWIPLLAASKVSATVVECHQLLRFLAFQEPSAGVWYMQRRIELELVEDIFGDFPRLTFPYIEKREPPQPPCSHYGRYGGKQKQERFKKKPLISCRRRSQSSLFRQGMNSVSRVRSCHWERSEAMSIGGQVSRTVSKSENRVGNAAGLVRRGSRTALNQGVASGAPTTRITPEAILRHSHLACPVMIGSSAFRAGPSHRRG